MRMKTGGKERKKKMKKYELLHMHKGRRIWLDGNKVGILGKSLTFKDAFYLLKRRDHITYLEAELENGFVKIYK